MPRGEGLKKVIIDFSSVKDLPISAIYGSEKIKATELAVKTWAFIKKNNLKTVVL